MLRPTALLAAALLVVVVCDRVAARPASTEPPMELSLTIGGVEHALTLGRSKEIEVLGKRVTVRLTASSTRLFDNTEGVRFRYPRNFAFGFQAGEGGYEQWTLDGNRCVIKLVSVQAPGRKVGAVLGDFVSGVIDTWGENKVAVSSGTLKLGKYDVPTKRLRVTVSGVQLDQEIAAFGVGERRYVLMLLDKGRDESEETARVRQLLRDTFLAPR